MRSSILALALVMGFGLSFAVSSAAASTIQFSASGTLYSDGTAVSPTDPVITDPSQLVYGASPWTLALSYNTGAYSGTGGNYTLNNATAVLSIASYQFTFASSAGDTLYLNSPGVWGSGTTSLQICEAGDCFDNGYVNLYFVGDVSSPDTFWSDAASLSGDNSASPMAFEFLSNFADGSQTDLMGSIDSVSGSLQQASEVPEPGTWVLLASGLGLLAGVDLKRRRAIA